MGTRAYRGGLLAVVVVRGFHVHHVPPAERASCSRLLNRIPATQFHHSPNAATATINPDFINAIC
jgi:hypothetical protein